MNVFPNAWIKHFPHSFSNHCPLLLNTARDKGVRKATTFKFEEWWTLEKSLEGEIKRIWDKFVGSIFDKMESLSIGLIK